MPFKREDKILKKEEGLEHAEALSKISQEDLAKKWVSYHSAVTIHNVSLEEKHARISERESMCFVKEAELSQREADLAIKETPLIDRYQNLEQTINQLHESKKG